MTVKQELLICENWSRQLHTHSHAHTHTDSSTSNDTHTDGYTGISAHQRNCSMDNRWTIGRAVDTTMTNYATAIFAHWLPEQWRDDRRYNCLTGLSFRLVEYWWLYSLVFLQHGSLTVRSHLSAIHTHTRTNWGNNYWPHRISYQYLLAVFRVTRNVTMETLMMHNRASTTDVRGCAVMSSEEVR